MKTECPLLVIDSSTKFVYAALWDFHENKWHKIIEKLLHLSTEMKILIGKNTLSDRVRVPKDKWLSYLIREILQETGLEKLEYIALGRGPGSFTSLRIGHAMIRTLAMLWGASVFPFSSLEFWHSVFDLKKNEYLILRINRNLYYGFVPGNGSSFFAKNKDEWISFSKESKMKPALWLETWPTAGKNLNKEQGHGIGPWTIDFRLLSVQNIKKISFDLPSISDISRKSKNWESIFPEYGHDILL